MKVKGNKITITMTTAEAYELLQELKDEDFVAVGLIWELIDSLATTLGEESR